MVEVSVVADDLTGALDTGVKFTAPGRQVGVLWKPGVPIGDVVILDTETRSLSPEDAAKVVMSWAPLAHGQLYKKMDSTLRGPFAAEACALARARGMRGILYAPSFPASRRTVIGGRLFIDGRPVADTQFAADPVWPVRESDVSLTVEAQTGCRPELLPIARVRQGLAAVTEAMDGSGGALVADAETEADLAVLARALRLRPSWLPVGSAGLAGAIAAEMGYGSATVTGTSLGRGFVLVCGSAHPVNRRQVARLAEVIGTRALEVGSEAPLAVSRVIREDFVRTGLAVLTTPYERLGGEALALQQALADQASRAVQELDARGVFVTGGQTLLSVLRALGAEGLWLEAELEPGVVLSRTRTAGGRLLWVVSKAGGFGDEDTLVRLFAGEHSPSISGN